MSKTFTAQTGLALVIDKETLVSLVNRKYPTDKVDAGCDLEELVDVTTTLEACDETVCESLEVESALWGLDFGRALEDANVCACDPNTTWFVQFAPKGPDYFDAPYADLDALVKDIIAENELLDEGDASFVHDHIGYVRIVWRS